MWQESSTSLQVACKLTPLAPLHPVDPPLPNSRNPATPAPNNDDLGNILALGVQNRYIDCKEKLARLGQTLKCKLIIFKLSILIL